MSTPHQWALARRFNHENPEEFYSLLAAGRLRALRCARTTEELTVTDATAVLLAGRNVYADVLTPGHNPVLSAVCDRCGTRTTDFDVRDYGTDAETGYRDEETVCGCCAYREAGELCRCADCEGVRIDAAQEWAADHAYDMSVEMGDSV